ncbi:sensor histidine kinase [Paenibacillus polymyxa]|uniref:histidine kinase n=1 Tax=Paenibacillus polymyxa TaxID=1406 RepID=A0A378XSJ6_PAEPO|nr:sensor histidine kinase [Paenibacillus polymyxa]MEB4784383.1 sensor histidine kinase [Paenibacillus jamilae]MBE7897626.1 sensor histidine kinase [Paenibacillus polymyxa]MBG9764168.1 histidine kinase [Paenibacillus polymyxa]MCC3260493.1 sensor histidine kinase [Paenibacillus polymyxa]MDN4076396.1 sensor histidine kinase [Paenibacillus polymyxa]
MQKWYQIFQRNTGLSPYVWVVFYILPFYYFSSSSTSHIILGTAIILVFFACYVLAFVSQGWLIYFWTSVQIAISITMTLLFSYMYFSIFIAYLIGNMKSKAAFTTLYIILMVITIGLINYGFVSQNPVFIKQIPFILLNLIGVILLPITNFNRNKSDRLQVQLEDANKKISELIKLEERQRIARDLHDTLGQKLSLIGLKSDLAGKLLDQYPERAHAEINDVRLTARSALKEVREMVTQMRGMRLEDELLRIRQILKAAHIELTLEGDPKLEHTSLMNENVLSMCMKEAVTNVVKHSGATACSITIEPSRKELTLRIQDNGVGITGEYGALRGNGLQGMKERLEFVNGCMELRSDQGTTLVIKVPNITEKPNEEVGP